MTHLEAMRCVREIQRVRVWSRSTENGEHLAAAALQAWGIVVEVSPTAQAAVKDAHIICTTTASREPVVEHAWLAPGVHINAVGASVATARELDTSTVVASRLYVDRRESAMAESGDFLIPRDEGAISNEHIVGELGDLVLGRAASRTSAEQITLFKSLGLAIEDIASARFIYEQALVSGAGTWIDIGGLR